MEICSIVSKIIDKLVDVAYNLVLKHVGYVVSVTKNVEAVEDSTDLLRQRRADISSRIAREERNGKKATEVAKGWVQKAVEYEGHVDRIKQDYEQMGCCLFGCSFDCCSNYRIAKEAAERDAGVKELLARGDFSDGVTEDQQPPPVQVITTSSRARGLAYNIERMIQFLKEDENFMLGIWGVGGVGKTTLLTEVNNSLVQDPLGFHHVIMVVASHGCTTEEIQDQIIDNLKLPKKADASTRDRAAIITSYLIGKNFVLILDDIWESLDLAEVGIPHPHCCNGDKPAKHWKVIIVSRDEAVCSQMQARKKLHIECLGPEDAWNLFEEKVGEATIKSHHIIRGLAEKIVEECRGLPLALVIIGRAMSTKKTPQGWRHALSMLQKSRQIPGTQEQLFSRLRLSYDYLEEDGIRNCFLYCCLWPEDHDIDKDKLIECWMGHGLIDDFDNIIEAYDIG